MAPAVAQTCEPLPVLGSTSTEVNKTVSPPGLLLVNTNWNTDFVADGSYDYFLVNFTSESGETYDVDVNLKYPDDSVDSAYSIREGTFPEGETVVIEASSRVASDPYQVNLRVGGIYAEGNTYSASVSGCR
jgi:hypothetical protein